MAVLGEGVHKESEHLEDGVVGGQTDQDVHKARLGLGQWRIINKELKV